MIGAIANHEWGRLIRSPSTWVILAVLQVVLAWLFLSALEGYLGATPELNRQDHPPGVTAWLTYRYMAPVSALLLLIIPVLTMRSFADEVRLSTHSLLFSSPVPLAAIVVGKYLGLVLLTTLITCLVVWLPLTLFPLTTLDFRTLGTAFAALLLLCSSAVAMGLYFSITTRQAMMAAIATGVILLLLWLLANANFSSDTVSEGARAIALANHLGLAFQGIIATSDLGYFIILTVLFLSLSLNSLCRFRYSERAHVWRHHLITVLLLMIALSLLWLNHQHTQRIDISANARHSLNAGSIDTVSAMDRPLEIIAVVGPMRSTRDSIESLISDYRAYKPDISLTFVNPETDPAAARALSTRAGGEIIVRYGNREARLDRLSERALTGALHEVSRSNQRTAAFITGHGERAPDRETNDDFLYLATQLKQSGITPITLSLVSVPRIPDNIDVLIIAAPQTPYFPGEIASIMEYVDRGGNLLWLIDDNTTAGLDLLALNTGIDPLSGTVIDVSSQAFGADSPTVVVLDSLPANPINSALNAPLVLSQTNALNITPLAGQTVLPLLLTGADSWTESGPINGEITFDDNGVEQRGPLTLGVTLERPLAQRTQRMAILGDADLFASTWIGNGANRDFGNRLLNWLTADDALLDFAIDQPADQLQALSKRQILVLGVGTLTVLPLLFLLIAGWLWRRGRQLR